MLAYSGHVMTLANSIIGVGILAMPFCFQKCGIVLSVLLLIISNWITRISCHYLIKSSLLTRRKSLEFLGFHAFGASGKLLAELCIIGYLFGTSITYFVVMGDLGPQITSKIFSLNAADFPHLRTWVMIAVTLFCILPLAMLKNVDSLSTVCAASIGFYVCLVVKIVLESEEHIVAHDWVEKVEYWRPAGILQCLPIFSMALSCQMQLFEVFESINNQSVEKLNGIVRNATWICTFVYIAVGYFGYVAFCTQTFSGNILLNFSPSFGSDVIKIGFVLSVAFSFPLVIFPCRASIYSLLYRKGHTDNTAYIPETRFKVITICLVSCALCIALMIPSVELIIGLVGSTIGVAICIMFPAFCFRKIVKKDSTERSLAQFIFVSGFCLMVLGTYANLHAIDERRSGAHLAKDLKDANLMKPTEKVYTMEQETAALFVPQIDKIEEENHFRDLKLKKNELELNAQLDIEKKSDLLRNVTPIQPISPISADDTQKKEETPKDNVIAEKAGKGFSIVSPKSELKDEDEAPKVSENVRELEKQNVPPNNILKSLPNQLPPQQQYIPSHLPQEKQSSQQNQQQQAIDKEAIKKDEEIAAEEYKNGQKASKSNNDVDLKETRKELKKTKELLERTVDQLKQELAKQNEETQNLVAEKLEEVVQKVEQIEKKVQHNEPAQTPVKYNEETGDLPPQEFEREPKENAVPPKKLNFPKVENKPEERPSLLNLLSEQAAEERPQQQVFEPLSYKAGELIEQVKNASKVEQRLPLPLAVLFNATNIKTNNHSNIHERAIANKSLNFSPHTANNASVTKNIKTENSTQIKPSVPPLESNAQRSSSEKENVEAIRRDILQLNSERLKEFPSLALSVSEIENDTDLAAAITPHLREKRSNMSHLKTPDYEAIDSKSHGNNCVTEPKEEQLLLAHGGLSNAIDFKMKNIGRELRSVIDDDEVKH
ncbi:putative sodium-coupled neutral amino acid transporter 10 isoform X1 [Rhagoletis pomonella]|uniref:putative sodium-coupled neutral amino acid transporter 10 isoform X1 n=2 Tax=Rhagoletis pomonella TaxID=28610 RepID=UPI001781CBBB|nr:putative sodium-coupled neutral amino acid transporter 10 isoform X1 [Rhagoletis pomonella]